MNVVIFIALSALAFASADSSIGGYSYETPYDSYGLDQNSGWHPPQQTHRSSIANMFRTNARQALTDPMMLMGTVGAGGALANAIYTTTATAGVSKAVVLTNGRVDASNKRIATVETRSSNTCAQLKSLLSIADPTVTYSTSAPATVRKAGEFTSCVASGSLTSGSTADCVATDLLDTYTLATAIRGSSAVTYSGLPTGIAISGQSGLGTTASGADSALSIPDFNTFRKRVAQAINALDKKIEQLLAISAPTC